MRLSKISLLTLIVVILLAGIAWASGWQYSGIGARPKALGGAYRGISNDAYGAYYNPGGLAFLEQNVFNVTAELSSPRPNVTPNFTSNGYGFGYLDGQKRYPEDKVYLMGEACLFVKPQKTDKIVLGMAFYQDYDHNADMNLYQLSPAYSTRHQVPSRNHHSNFDVITWQPTIAMKFSQDRLGIGLGIQIHRGDMFTDQIRLIDNPYPYPLNARPFDKLAELVSVDGFGYGVGVNVGIQYKASPKVTLGANYVSASKIKIDGDSKEQLYFPYNQAIVYLYTDDLANQNEYFKEIARAYQGPLIGYDGQFKTDLKLPSEFGFGLAYKASEKTTITADIAYTMWSEFEDVKISFSNRKTDTLAVPPTWAGLFADVTYPMQWKDKVKISVGLEKIMNTRWTARGGYMFDPSPIPDETLSELFMDSGTKHHLSGGANFKLNDKVSFDAALELVIFGSRDISKLSDVNNDGYWDNFGGEFKNMSFNTTWSINYRF